MKWNVALTLLVLLSSTSCETAGPASNSYCDNAKAIYLDRADVLTEGTLRAIIMHNEKGAALCQWKPVR